MGVEIQLALSNLISALRNSKDLVEDADFCMERLGELIEQYNPLDLDPEIKQTLERIRQNEKTDEKERVN